MKLQCASLFEQSAYIGGVWVDNTSLPRVPVINPSTHEIIGSVPHPLNSRVGDVQFIRPSGGPQGARGRGNRQDAQAPMQIRPTIHRRPL
jgi:hypothetical protein